MVEAVEAFRDFPQPAVEAFGIFVNQGQPEPQPCFFNYFAVITPLVDELTLLYIDSKTKK